MYYELYPTEKKILYIYICFYFFLYFIFYFYIIIIIEHLSILLHSVIFCMLRSHLWIHKHDFLQMGNFSIAEFGLKNSLYLLLLLCCVTLLCSV